MKYFAVKFERYIPSVEGMSIICALEGYNIVGLEDFVNLEFLDDLPKVELSEGEATIGRLYYGEARPYRKAYSDVEGLEPDEDELAKGDRRTKVYHDESTIEYTLGLYKKVAKRLVIEEFDTRADRVGESDLLQEIDSISAIDQMLWWKEEKFGIEVPWPLARTRNLIEETALGPRRLNSPGYGVKF